MVGAVARRRRFGVSRIGGSLVAVIDRLKGRGSAADVDLSPESLLRYDLNSLLHQVQFQGNTYPFGLNQTFDQNDPSELGPNPQFVGLVNHAYRTGGPVFACILARQLLFSEARFQWQRIEGGRPSGLFGNASLGLLERPWPRGTTGELLNRAEQDVSLGGTAYIRRNRGRLWRLRPDYMTVVLGSMEDADHPMQAPDAEVVGFIFKAPGGKPYALLPEEVAAWSPIPDPVVNYRGQSWVSTMFRDVEADNLAILHKSQFFRRAATVNIVVLPDATVTFDEFKKFKTEFVDEQEGAWNAYKTLFLGGGSKIEKVGLNMKEMDYKGIMGISETRIASAAGVPPIIAGFSEGLASATYSNYGMARRKFGDHWARPQWRSFAAAVSHLLDEPQGVDSGQVRLWYDDRDIAFLREDSQDEAKIRQTDAVTINQLITAGYEPDAAASFVQTGNAAELVGKHSGRLSVQLQPMDGGDIDDDEGDDDDEPDPPGFNTDDDDEEDDDS